MKKKIDYYFFLFFALLPLCGFSDFILNDRESAMINHVTQSMALANHSLSKLNSAILRLNGTSSRRMRHFLNNICSLPEAVYLEIGMRKGATLISALYKNESTMLNATGIDNWSNFEDFKKKFYSNIKLFIPKAPLEIFETDYFSLPINQIFQNPVNIYFYGGDHSFLNQQLAFTYYYDILDDAFITIVEDWDQEQIRLSTMAIFENLEFTILYETELSTESKEDPQEVKNDLYIAVIRKNSDRS